MDENAPPSQKHVKRRKPLRNRFKRTKNDERRSQIALREEERVLKLIPSNVQQAPATLETLKSVDAPGWTLSGTEQEDTLQFCILRFDPPTVVRSVTVSSDLTWYAHVLGKVVLRPNVVIQSLPAKVSSETSAFIDDREEIVLGQKSYAKTVRRSDCALICSRNSSSLRRCPSCSKYRSQLFVERSREAKKSANRTSHDSHVNFRCLNPSEKDERMRNLGKAKRAEKQRNVRLRDLLLKKIEEEGVALTQKDSDDISSVLSDVSPLVKNFSEGSILRIFWEQQVKYNSLKDRRQMRWHPLLIRFALNLKYSSTSAYRAVRESGLISLPSERTLRDYTHWAPIRDGPQVEVLQHIKRTIGLDGMSTSEKHFALGMVL